VIAFPRLQELARKHNADFAQAYADADGNTRKARRALRSKLVGLYGLDPATIAMIFALIQLAFKVWKWAKDNGYLSAYDASDAPMGYILQKAWDGGEFEEIFERIDESDDE
jgi:hypothetical protein